MRDMVTRLHVNYPKPRSHSFHWLVVLTILKHIRQREWLSHILWNIKHVPNHQPVPGIYHKNLSPIPIRSVTNFNAWTWGPEPRSSWDDSPTHLFLGAAIEVIMWVKQCHKPSPKTAKSQFLKVVLLNRFQSCLVYDIALPCFAYIKWCYITVVLVLSWGSHNSIFTMVVLGDISN